MKQSKRISIFTVLLMSVGLLTFIPSTVSPAQAAASCVGATCTQTFAYSGSAQTFTPPTIGIAYAITVNGATGGRGGNDAGTTGGAAYGGSRVVITYTASTLSPLYIYTGSAGANGGSAVACGGGGGAGTNPWSAYNGGGGGGAGCTGTSGAGAGGGAATVVSTGDKTGVIAVAGGGAGGGGASLWGNGTAGNADTGAQNSGTSGSWGGNCPSADGAGGGGGGGGYTGGTGGIGADDSWSPGGRGGVTGKSFPSAAPAVVTANANNTNGSVTISWPNGPVQTTAPSFTDNTTAKVGQVLTPADGTFSATAGTLSIGNRRWQISTDGTTWTDISPKVSGNYTIAAGDAGKYLRFAEDATDSSNTLTYASQPSLRVTDVPSFTAETLTGTAANTIVNSAYAGYSFQATGYRNVFSISAGTLPAGITLDPATGALAGTSTVTGTYNFKVKVTNEAGSDETANLTLIVGRSPVFTSDDSQLQSVNRVTNPIRVGTALPDFVFTTRAYPAATYELKVDSATIPTCVTFALTCASAFETLGLPDGLTFDPATATLKGTPTKSGAFVFAIKANNSVGSDVEIVHMSIAAKAPVAFSLSSDKNAVTIVQNTTVTAVITATGGSGNGAYSFFVDPTATSICSLSASTANTVTMTVLAAGNCVINGVKAADGGFAASKASITIPVNKAPQTAPLSVVADTAPLTYGSAWTWLRGTGGNGTGAFTWTVDPSSTATCTVNQTSGNNMYMYATSAGTCVYNATKGADGYFQAQTTQYTMTVDKAQMTGLYIGNPGAVNWSSNVQQSVTLSTGGGQGTGAVTYTLDPSSADTCTLNGNVLVAKSAGTCNVTATKAGDTNYKPMTSAAVTWTIYQIGQSTLSTTAASTNGTNIPYNSNVTYVASPAVLAVLTTTGGSGTGTFSYVASNGSGCVVSGNGATAFVTANPTGTGTGWCTISITKNGDANFNTQTTNFQFYIPTGPQTPLVATPANTSMDYVPTTLTDPTTAAKTQISLTGGLGTGVVSYAVAAGSGTVCSVDANGLITDKTAGTCVINISKAGDANYQAQSTTATVTFNKLNQAELVSTSPDSSKPFVWSPKATSQITTTGGSGTGGVTYAIDPSSTGICTVGYYNGLISDVTAGTCTVIVTKAADTNYNVATDTVTVVFTKVNPSAISLSASPTSVAYTTSVNKNTTWVTVSGGNYSTGAYTFYVDPMTEEYCSIINVRATQVQVQGNLAGLCLITVVLAADVNYNEQRAFLGINITKMVQTINATSSNGTSPWFKVSPDVTTTINVTGQAGTGVTRYVVDPANNASNCSVDQATGNVTSTGIGSCKITVTRDGDDNVAQSNSVVINLTIAKINQGAITLTPSADFKLAAPGSAASTSVLTVGTAYTGTGNFTKIVSITPTVCTIAGGGDSAANPATFQATNDLTNRITVTAVDDGTCTLQYSKLGDSNFNPLVNGTASFTIGKATQADITTSIAAGSANMPFVASPKATATIAGAGGTGSGTFNYSVDPASSGVCSVNQTTGVVSDVTAGTCVINVKRLGDTNYLDSNVKSVTITFTKIDQAAFTVSAAKTALRATTLTLDSTTLSSTGGSGTGAVTYAVASDSASICSVTGAAVTGLGAGDCNIIATKAADANYNVATATIKLTITKGTQAPLVVTPYWASIGYIPQTPADSSLVNAFVWSGGTGSGDLVFSIDPSSAQVCNRAGMRPGIPSHIQVFALGSGTCTITVYKSGGSAWENSNTVTSSFTITKVAQTGLTATPSKNTLQFFDSPAATFTVSTTGGTGSGAQTITIAQASANICADATVNGGPLTIKTTGVGTCNFTITKAADPGYLATTSAQVSVTITKGTQTPLVATASPAALNYQVGTAVTSLVTVTGGSGNGARTISVDSGSTAVCSYNNTTKLITALAPGRCDLTITQAAGADGLFNAATTKLTVNIAKTAQTKLTLTAQYPQLMYSDSPKATTALSIGGGSGSGAVTYSVDPGATSVCSVAVVNGLPTVTANYYGFCVVTATKAGDSVFADATASVTIRIALPGTQISANADRQTAPFVAAPGTVATITVSGANSGDVQSYSVDAASRAICSVSGNGTTAVVTSLAIGPCNILVINVSKAQDGTLIASSSVASITITKGDQVNATATPETPFVYFATPAATDVITVAGGITGSTITAAVDATTASNCSVAVAGNRVTMTALQVGNCLINITKSGNANYNDFTTQLSIEVKKSRQAALTVSASPTGLTYSANSAVTSAITVTGGSGTGAISYAVDDSTKTVCSIAGNVITAITGGNCIVNVTKAGDTNYAEATASITVNIAKGSQSALTASAARTNLVYNKDAAVTTTLSTTGGSGTGAVSYAVTQASAAICSVTGNVVTVIRPGSCVITATKASDPYFNEATATVSITIDKSAQDSLSSKVATGEVAQPQWNGKTTTQLVITGGDGFGSLSLTGLTPNVCSVALVGQRVNVTAIVAGTCQFRVVKDGDYAFLASDPLTVSVTVDSAATDLSVTITTAGNATAGQQAAIDLTVVNNGPAKAAGASVVYTLPTGVTAVTPLNAGCVLTSATRVTCSTNNVIEVNGTVRFTIPISLAQSLVGGQYTSGGEVNLTSATPDSDTSNNIVTGDSANFIVSKAPTGFDKTTLAGMQTGKDFADQITASGFPAVTYVVSAGDLPAGLTLDPATGEIEGKPTGVGKYTFTVTAFNAAGSVSQVYTGTIAAAPFVTAPSTGFGPNTLPAGTKVTIGGLNLDLISSAIIGGKSVKILSKSSLAITLEVPSSQSAGQVDVSLVYAQGTLDAGTFTYTGATKTTPTLILSAGNGSAGAGEPSRTLTTSITAPGIDGEITMPVTYTSKTTSVCTVSANQLTFVAAGTCTVVAATAANTSFNAGLSANVSLTVTKSNQTITVTLPKDTTPVTPATDSADGFDLTAVASSGLTPVFASLTPEICDVTEEGHATGIKAGRCRVSVSQPGDARFNAATSTTMEFDITVDDGSSSNEVGDPLHPTALPSGQLVRSGSVGFTWDRKLGFLYVQTYGVWLGKINAKIEFTISGKNYQCSVDFGVLKAMPGKTAAQLKAAFAAKVFKAPAPLCNTKKEAPALAALKKGFAGLQIKASFTRYLMWPTTMKPFNEKTKKAIPTHYRATYITLG